MFRAIRWLLAKTALAAGLAGLILHATVRDSRPQLAPIFYALPLPAAGVFLMLAALMAGGRRTRRLVGFLALAVLGFWFFESYGWAYPVRGKWKAVTWNIARPHHPFQPLIALVKAERPDVIALVESGEISPADARAYEHDLPGYHMVAAANGLSCLARGEIVASPAVPLVNGAHVARFRIKLGGERWSIFVADIGASPLIPRRPQLEKLAEMTRNQSRTIVLGDFNTPLESVHLSGMRSHFAEVMDGPHRGFRETWFYGLPLLSLDQIWLSRDLEARFTTRRPTFASDHAPVIATFSVRE